MHYDIPSNVGKIKNSIFFVLFCSHKPETKNKISLYEYAFYECIHVYEDTYFSVVCASSCTLWRLKGHFKQNRLKHTASKKHKSSMLSVLQNDVAPVLLA